MNQILTLLNLYSEFIILLVAASVLSLFVGWMMSRSSSKKRMNAVISSWEKRYKALEETGSADTENLEEQLQEIAGETRALKANNKVLTESLKKNDLTIQKARAEAIELNRQHAETQERLQRIIQQKEKDISDRSVSAAPTSELNKRSGSTYTAPIEPTTVGAVGSVFLEDIDDDLEDTLRESTHAFGDSTLSLKEETDDTSLISAATVAINPADAFDATVQMSADDYIHQQKQKEQEDSYDEFIEDTADVSGAFMEEIEESTVVLDEDSIEFAKRPFPVSNVD